MSGIMVGMMASNPNSVLSSNAYSSSTIAAGTGSSTAKVSFQSDGTATHNGTGNSPSWYSGAPIVGIGNSYWFSLNAGAWTTLSNINSTTLTGTNAFRTDTYRIATDGGGLNIVGSGSISLDVSNGA